LILDYRCINVILLLIYYLVYDNVILAIMCLVSMLFAIYNHCYASNTLK